MKVLLSIKPEFAEKIFEGTKRYVFRRTLFKNPDVKTVVVYASSPVKKVIGEFEIDSVLHLETSSLWENTKEFAGISEEYFFDYFGEKKSGFAIKIKKSVRYPKALSLEKEFNAKPPQSFVYLE
ncbi:MAG TPA: hypothetical protein PKH79_13635 [Prolixibacteraceae bacterium]|nr:hypothetical protein [Prolixibacteraceae bacterium]